MEFESSLGMSNCEVFNIDDALCTCSTCKEYNSLDDENGIVDSKNYLIF